MKIALLWLIILMTFFNLTWAEEVMNLPESEIEAFNAFKEKKSCNQGFIEINWSIVSGVGSYTVDTRSNNISNIGIMVEPFYGVQIPSVENMKIGFAPAFYSLTGAKSFIINEQVSPTLPLRSQNWDVNTSSVATLLMVKYMFGVTLENINIEIFNGIGYGYFRNHLSWEWRDPTDPTNTVYSGNDEVQNLLPCIDIGIQLRTQISESSSLGAHFGVNRLTIEMDNFEMPFVFKYGLSYINNF
ncbi:MAG: hypothetical protein AB1439_11870 [candidate division FCPU426 bacterium]